jgi:hypothetical protein
MTVFGWHSNSGIPCSSVMGCQWRYKILQQNENNVCLKGTNPAINEFDIRSKKIASSHVISMLLRPSPELVMETCSACQSAGVAQIT